MSFAAARTSSWPLTRPPPRPAPKSGAGWRRRSRNHSAGGFVDLAGRDERAHHVGEVVDVAGLVDDDLLHVRRVGLEPRALDGTRDRLRALLRRQLVAVEERRVVLRLVPDLAVERARRHDLDLDTGAGE